MRVLVVLAISFLTQSAALFPSSAGPRSSFFRRTLTTKMASPKRTTQGPTTKRARASLSSLSSVSHVACNVEDIEDTPPHQLMHGYQRHSRDYHGFAPDEVGAFFRTFHREIQNFYIGFDLWRVHVSSIFITALQYPFCAHAHYVPCSTDNGLYLEVAALCFSASSYFAWYLKNTCLAQPTVVTRNSRTFAGVVQVQLRSVPVDFIC